MLNNSPDLSRGSAWQKSKERASLLRGWLLIVDEAEKKNPQSPSYYFKDHLVIDEEMKVLKGRARHESREPGLKMIELQLSLLSELERITLWKRKKQHLGCRQQDDVSDHPLVSNQVGGEEPRSAKEEFMMMVITMMERHNMKMDCQKMTMMANCRWLWWRRCWWWWWGWCWWW